MSIIIKDYSNNRTIGNIDNNRITIGSYKYSIDRDFIKDYSSGKIIYQIDGKYIKDYSNNSRLLKIDDKYIKDYSSNRRLLEIDKEYVKDYSSSRKLLQINGSCLLKTELLAALIYLLYKLT